MAIFPEYEQYDALGLADLVRKGETTPTELLDAAIERVEHENPVYNAVIHRMYERGREAIERGLPDGPFTGVPLLIKDHLSAYAGEPMASGSRFLVDHVPARHSELVERLLRAGFVIIGKTNTPELALLPTTEPELFGATRNPWDLLRTAGGSSGGAGAAVAARWVPIATGGDGGGSLRIPASCCGVFGLKPSRGRNPTGPYGELWEGFAVEHGLTRSVRDSAALLDATNGADVGAPYAAPPSGRRFLLEVKANPGKLRIVVTRRPILSDSDHADCQNAVGETIRLLRDLGHDVVEGGPRIDAAAFRRAMLTLLAGQTAADIREAERANGRKATHADFESSTWMLRVLGEAQSAGAYQEAVRSLQRTARSLAEFAEPFHAWLTPTLGGPPVRLGEFAPKGILGEGERLAGRFELGRLVIASGMADRVAESFFSFIPYTPLANATGQPSMSVPLHWNDQGLPIGVQFTARFGDEATLFRLAGQLERERPWFDKRPPPAYFPAARS